MIRLENEEETPNLPLIGQNHAMAAGDKDNEKEDHGGGTGTDVIAKPRTRTKKPRSL